MHCGKINIEYNSNTFELPYVEINTLIIGSGAAALNAAVQLYNKGVTNIAIATDNWGGGTSNNAGSDKQTYYKLSLAGKEMDSPYAMASDLFWGGCMHGDIALCEAHHSAESFYNLVNIGVPFPHDKYGGYTGYKTDNDSRARGTSAGPLTSHLMFQKLAKEVIKRGIPVFNNHEVVELLVNRSGVGKKVIGAIAINKKEANANNYGYIIFNSTNILLCTGGPAGMYKWPVYPESQTGSTGLALKIGAVAQNLTESQFGLGSVKFRWNVSGSYQQAIPRYVSTDKDGNDEREFLNDSFASAESLVNAIFLKGYQWPFNAVRIKNDGSSLIDILVHRETVKKGRRVFLDFTHNLFDIYCRPNSNVKLKYDTKFHLSLLNDEAYGYLEKSNALGRLPIERLNELNRPAIDLYKNNGIDIEREYLEIAVCAQHCNGGLKGNIWWESNIKNLFPIGEVAGTHGVNRPGGASLNAGQVGGIRAAMYISENYNSPPHEKEYFLELAMEQISDTLSFADKIIRKDSNSSDSKTIDNSKSERVSIQDSLEDIRLRMSASGSHIRNKDGVRKALMEAWKQFTLLKDNVTLQSSRSLANVYKLYDICLTHIVYLEAIMEYLDKDGKSRGSFIITNSDNELDFDLKSISDFVSNNIQEIWLDNNMSVKIRWVDVRPIPDDDVWFESVWRDFRDGKIIQ